MLLIQDDFWSDRNICYDGPILNPAIGECWVWLRDRMATGYGVLKYNGKKNTYAHRVSFLLSRGHWPENHACHHCDNPSCVRPDHLFDGTDADNHADKARKGRQPPARGGNIPWATAKLNAQSIQQSLFMMVDGLDCSQIASRLGVSPTTIRSVANGKRWRVAVAACFCVG